MVPFARLGALTTLTCLCLSSHLFASDTARFDLSGPKLDVRVTRQGKSLPVAAVPNLLEGDHLWLHADLPETQSIKYLLVAVFLRGTTNPPPDNWIVKIQTWDKKIKAEGSEVIVPPGAQQVLLLLAPETGGDVSALRSAIRARPGVFVRAAQDLDEAGFEQARIEKYLAEMRKVPADDTKAIAEHSDLLARTLNLKPNPDCFKKPVEAQYACLTQSGSQSLLDDGHGQSIVTSLTSGASSDLINSASTTQMAGGGMYSAYVGSIVDVVRIMSNLHTAHYSYIPAIAFPEKEALNLRLNTPPSFENPKSVIVIGMPPVQKASLPVLRASDGKHVTCLLRPQVALPVEGAPLVFSTSFAHDLVLQREAPLPPVEQPLTPDAFQGGLVVQAATSNRHQLSPATDAAEPTSGTETTAKASDPKVPQASGVRSGTAATAQGMATVSGEWGFDHFSGPTLPIQDAPGENWKLTSTDDHIIIGEQNHLLLSSSGSACIQSVVVQENGEADQTLEWKTAEKPNTIALNLTLHSNNPGAVHLIVHQFGKMTPEMLSVQAFSKPAELKGVDYHLGDRSLSIAGVNLSEVKQLSFDDLTFMQPVGAEHEGSVLSTSGAASAAPLLLKLTAGTASPKLQAGMPVTGTVTLADGRTLTLPFTVQAPRPSITILSRRVIRAADSPQIQLLNQDDVPLEARLILSLRSVTPFPRDGEIEIASEDDSLHDKLTLSDGSLVLQDRNTVLADLDLRKTFGSSAFGQLRLRLVLHDGTSGDWTPMATLVRLPQLTDLLHRYGHAQLRSHGQQSLPVERHLAGSVLQQGGRRARWLCRNDPDGADSWQRPPVLEIAGRSNLDRNHHPAAPFLVGRRQIIRRRCAIISAVLQPLPPKIFTHFAMVAAIAEINDQSYQEPNDQSNPVPLA